MSDDERVRPSRIRVGRMQEAHLEDLVRIETGAAGMYAELGFDGATVSPRTFREIGGLARNHSVWVAEADYVAAGYVAWRDEEPGVAYIEELSVDPALHRFGIGRKLIERVIEEANELKIPSIVVRAFSQAPWAAGFYAALSFRALDDTAPPKTREWLERKLSGQPWLRPGEVVLYR
jgi:N-acetylglutamate synthase-like GNAT family acetyltransferase